MKKLISIFLVVALVMAFSGCGSDRGFSGLYGDVPEGIEAAEANNVDVNGDVDQEEVEEVVESQETNINIEWTTFTYNETDSDGYTYEITFKISPWILLSNNDIISTVWNEVGGGNALPGFNDWSLRNNGNYLSRQLSYNGVTVYFDEIMTDMYYCMGTVAIKNITPDWHITSDHTRTIGEAELQWERRSTDTYFSDATCIGKMFYSNETTDHPDCIRVRPTIKSDNWGPVSFIIMAPENFSPNYPDGEYYEEMVSDGDLRIYSRSPNNSIENKYISIGIIGYDRVYTETNHIMYNP